MGAWEPLYLRVHDPHSRADCLRALAALDLRRPWEVHAKPISRQRTNAQNRRYFHLLRVASDTSGFTTAELHDLCKAHVLGVEVVKLGHTIVERPRSTTKLTVQDFSVYVSQVEAWLVAELNLCLDAHW